MERYLAKVLCLSSCFTRGSRLRSAERVMAIVTIFCPSVCLSCRPTCHLPLPI